MHRQFARRLEAKTRWRREIPVPPPGMVEAIVQQWVGAPTGQPGEPVRILRRQVLQVGAQIADRIISMLGEPPVSQKVLSPLSSQEIRARVKACPKLPSLRSIQGALSELLSSEQRYAGQIGDVIRRDPGLTTRLLRLVNSAYFGLSQKVTNLEEAVFFVGIRQIRELAAMTPVIEDFKKMAGPHASTWRGFWQHCIAVASLTRDLMTCVLVKEDDLNYVAGLVHDVGWLVMATAFPDHWMEIQRRSAAGNGNSMVNELGVLGMRHTEIGALFLECQDLSPSLANTSRFHHHPGGAGPDINLPSAVQIADLLACQAGMGRGGDLDHEVADAWLRASGWETLFGPNSDRERARAQDLLRRSVERLPLLLECLV